MTAYAEELRSRLDVLPYVVDVFCGDGGAGHGYLAGGATVFGIDLNRNHGKRYPGPFWPGDWRAGLDRIRSNPYLRQPDLVHLSPPCQRFTHGNVANGQAERHPDLIGPVRDYMLEWGVPFVIENVERAPLNDAVMFCGTMFGLEADDPASGHRLVLKRHRLFEAHGFTLTPPGPCRCLEHRRAGRVIGGVYGGARSDLTEARTIRRGGYVPADKAVRAALLGVDPDGFTLGGLSEAIPPAYATRVLRCFLESR